MQRPGRNDPCPCGSGRKVKRCCGVQRGPSPDELVRASLHSEAKVALVTIGQRPEEELEELFARTFELPARHEQLRAVLPEEPGPACERLRTTLAGRDGAPRTPEEMDPELEAAVTAAVAEVDSPQLRQRLLQATYQLRDEGLVAVDEAALVAYELSTPSDGLLRNTLVQALS